MKIMKKNKYKAIHPDIFPIHLTAFTLQLSNTLYIPYE